MTIAEHELSSWIGRRVLDVGGDPLGVAVDVYPDAGIGRPSWLAINTGFVGTSIAVVPVRGASLLGEHVMVAYDQRTVAMAPVVDVLVTVPLTHEQTLTDHYTRRAGAAAHPSRRQLI